MHGAPSKPALQHRIRLLMTERGPARHSAAVIGFDPRDAVAQARKRAGTGHIRSFVRFCRCGENS
jgi:hypothetical protein